MDFLAFWISVLAIHITNYIYLVESISTVFENQCEEEIGGKTYMNACAGQPIHVARFERPDFFIDVDPSDINCGRERAVFCSLGVQECEFCDNKGDTSEIHPPRFMVDTAKGGEDPNIWSFWQSVPWTQYPEPLQANITLSFGHLYQLQDNIEIRFRSGRPRNMILEKSMDFGQTWSPLQYFSSNCKNYPNISEVLPTDSTDEVLCTEEYSQEHPYAHGVVIFNVREDRLMPFLGPQLTDFYRLFEAYDRTNLAEFLSLTDLRIRLLYPATDGNEALKQTADLVRYHYGISDISVIGSCFCNLHASECSFIYNRTVCDCKHNTAGINCEICAPLYNNKPWQPGLYHPYPSGTANPCQKCECFEHADSCTYNSTLGFGICDDCQHNTTGLQCERCAQGTYPNASLPHRHTDKCMECDCDPLGVENNDTTCDPPDGQCHCKPFVTGFKCDQCQTNYYGLYQEQSTGQCKQCACNVYGTVGREDICDMNSGQCQCKPNIRGRDCSRCKDGYHGFPQGRPFGDCLSCDCDPGGSNSLACDKKSGICHCRPNLVPPTCDVPVPDNYIPFPDWLSLQPQAGVCDLFREMPGQGYPHTGEGYMQCRGLTTIEFDIIDGLRQPDLEWPYYVLLRYTLDRIVPWPFIQIDMYCAGDNDVFNVSVNTNITQRCPFNAGQILSHYNLETVEPGIDLFWRSEPIYLDKRCSYRLTLTLSDRGPGANRLIIDSFVVLPDLNYTNVFIMADDDMQSLYSECLQLLYQVTSREQALNSSVCKPFFFSAIAELRNGTSACSCDETGTVPNTYCERHGGQCRCKPGVGGQRCDRCVPGFYNFTSYGCTVCECDPLGSESLVCDLATGQCTCKRGVAGPGSRNVRDLQGDLQCRSCLVDHYGYHTGAGCLTCHCDPEGSNSTQCDDYGTCLCKESVGGAKCDECAEGYYLHSPEGCSYCNCSVEGSTSLACNQTSGECYCKANVDGDKCDTCARGTFNLREDYPLGCHDCFCYNHGVGCLSSENHTIDYIKDESTEDWEAVDLTTIGLAAYISAPIKYLGDKHWSYGQSLSFHIRTWKETVIGNETVVFLEGNNEILSHNMSATTYSAGNHQINIPLYYWLWYYEDLTEPTSDRFYGVLADLTALYIRRVYEGTMVVVSNVTLVTAREASPGEELATFVESCLCQNRKRMVDGLSCDHCEPGHRRLSGAPDPYDICTACECNGRTDTQPPVCDELTGQCLNCINGSTGHNCELCAPNVIDCELGCADGQCGKCQESYYGLSAEGCLSCDCDLVGSFSNLCNVTDGQCDCKERVTGRRCDVCEDNSFNFSLDGCQACDDCYGLIMLEVRNLQNDHANKLTELVMQLQDIQTSHSFSQTFSHRLDYTLRHMYKLKIFLLEAMTIYQMAEPEIVSLNSSLISMQDTVGLALEELQECQDRLGRSAFLVNRGTVTANQTTDHIMSVNHILTGDFPEERDLMSDLLYWLVEVRDKLMDLSAWNVGGVGINIIVRDVQTQASRAKSLADAAYLIGQRGIASHQLNTRVISNLKTDVTPISDTLKTLPEKIKDSESTIRSILSNVTNVEDSMDNITSIPVDLNQIKYRFWFLKSEADSLSIQATGAVYDRDSVVQEVSQATSSTRELMEQVQELNRSGQGSTARIEDTYNKALLAQADSKNSFNDASHMLDIMRNFNIRAEDVKAEANNSLNKVHQIQTSAQDVIRGATDFMVSIRDTFQAAQRANDQLTSGSTLADTYSTVMTNFVKSGINLQNHLNSLSMLSSRAPVAVMALNSTKIGPAGALCTKTQTQAQALQDKTAFAESKSEILSTAIQEQSSKIETILKKFQNIGRINQDELEELHVLAKEVKEQFTPNNRQMLKNSIQRMRAALSKQKEMINSIRDRRDHLQSHIRRLRDLTQEVQGSNRLI